MDFVELCRNMHLLSELPEYIKPRNVALMFFNPEPDKFFPYVQIDVVQFPEGEGGDRIIEQTFKGPLHEQFRSDDPEYPILLFFIFLSFIGLLFLPCK